MEPKFEEFFNVLFEAEQNFEFYYEEFCDWDGNIVDVKDWLKYNGFESPDRFNHILTNSKDNLICDLRLKYSTKYIDDNYLDALIDRLSKVCESFVLETVQDQECKVFEPFIIFDCTIGSKGKYKTFEVLNEKHLTQFLKYNQFKYEIISGLLSDLESLRIYTPLVSKLKFNLSVPDILLFFNLLKDEKLIEFKHYTDILRFIASNVSSKQKDEISLGSLQSKSKYYTSASINHLKPILSNMTKRLNNIDKNGLR